MNFTTIVPISKSNSLIDYHSKIVSLGSCFAENIADKFDYFKFQNTANPFGIIFNPISIEKIIQRIVQKKYFTEEDIFFYNDLWHSYEVHSTLSNSNKDEFLINLNQIIEWTNQQIIKSTHIIITYGTSWVYRNKSSDQIVANCHKVSQNQFDKEILSVEVIQKSIDNTINLIQKINQNCNFIFTLSPVRHTKDGFIENQRSKAHLITAIHNSQFIIQNYFPSYEIMMDELRDYRFYTQDMLHPNQLAIDYIWERFFQSQIAENIFPIMEHVFHIQKDLAHKPFNPNSEKHQQFLFKIKDKITKLVVEYPFMKF